jgi:hypothetical protein
VIFLNLALPERTCYEPLASTHPDTQGHADRHARFDMQPGMARRTTTNRKHRPIAAPRHSHRAASNDPR